MNTTPTTELEAVNEMLGTIGESPVTTLLDSGVVDAAIALQILTSVSRQVQSKGWTFNTDIEYNLTPSLVNNNLVIPTNTLRVDTTAVDFNENLVQRGSRMYDPVNHTYEFTRDYKVNLVTMLDFSELPEPARYYIMVRAARIFQERTVGSATLTGFTEKDETWAKITLIDYDGDIADSNILDGMRNITER